MNRAARIAHRIAHSDGTLRALPAFICLLWGGGPVATEIALAQLPPLRIAAIRTGLGSLTLLLWAWASRGSPNPLAASPIAIAVLSLLNTLMVGLFILALNLTAASHVAVLVYLYPAFTALLAHALLQGDTLNLRTATGLALGFSGAALTLSDATSDTRASALAGDLLAIGSACVWALQTTYIKHVLPATRPLSLALYPTLISMLAFIVISLVLEPPVHSTLSWPVLLALLYQGIIVTAATKAVWIVLIGRFRASVLSAYTFLTPVSGVLASAIFLGDTLSTSLLLGLALVVLALVTLERRRLLDGSLHT